jgi:hypothetical protein
MAEMKDWILSRHFVIFQRGDDSNGQMEYSSG